MFEIYSISGWMLFLYNLTCHYDLIYLFIVNFGGKICTQVRTFAYDSKCWIIKGKS